MWVSRCHYDNVEEHRICNQSDYLLLYYYHRFPSLRSEKKKLIKAIVLVIRIHITKRFDENPYAELGVRIYEFLVYTCSSLLVKERNIVSELLLKKN